jgi:hypothetical protein
MKLSRGLFGVAASLALLVSAAAVQAQTGQAVKANSLADVSALVKPDQQIEVVRRDGPTVIGHLTGISDAGVTLLVAGQVVYVPSSAVDQIARRGDSILDGAIRGAAAGAGGGLAWVLLWGSALTESDDKAALKRGALPLIGMSAAIGAGLGAAIDAAVQQRVVVFGAQKGRITIAPILGGHRKGLAVAVSF